MYNNQPKRTIDFNTEPILNDIDNIVKDGLTKLLGQYLNRYELLERTHQAIMNLPSVVDELANRTVSYNFPPLIEERQNEKDLQAMISANENLLARVDILSKENEELTNELRELKKQLFKDSIDLTVDEVHVKVETLVPVTIDSVEKENIRLEIEENDVPEEEESDEEQDVEEIPAGTKLGGKTWDGDDWETDDEYEDVAEDEQVVVEKEDEQDVEESDVDEPKLQEEDVDEDEQDVEESVEEEDEQEEDEQEEDEQEEDEQEEDEQEEDEQEDDVQGAEESDVDEVVEEVSVETEKSDSEEEQEVGADEDEEIFEIDIDDTTYCTNNEENGFIYELNNGEMGDKIGYLKDGEPFFYADEN
jgi:hypothetical protein